MANLCDDNELMSIISPILSSLAIMGIVEFSTLAFYGLATIAQILVLQGKIRRSQSVLLLWGLPAIVLHGALLYRWIDGNTAHIQNLYISNVISLLAWLMGVLLLLTTLRKPVQSMGLFIFPVAAMSILLVNLYPGNYFFDTGANPRQLIHILSAILAFSVLSIAAFQAVLLAVQDDLLRYKRANNRLLRVLPPVETMENLLFEIIWTGFILLTFVVMTSLLFFQFGPGLTHSPTLVLLAWLTFALLLWGHYYWGWRGRTAVRWTLAGAGMLVLSYICI